MKNFVIIGTGPAGIAAGQAIRTHDADAKITLIGDDPHLYYSRPGLAYFLTGEIPEKSLFPYTQIEFQGMGFHILHKKVGTINPAEHYIENLDGEKTPYDRLLIATGSRASRLNAPGENLEGIATLDTLDDARKILNLARGCRSAVVTGGGITALEIAEGLMVRGIKVHYILRAERYWPNILDGIESRIIEYRLREHGIDIHSRTELTEILGERGHVTGVLTKDGKRINCGMVAMAIGIRPRTELAIDAGLTTDRGIVVDEYLQTNVPDIFAAGDVAQVYDPLTGQSVIDSLWGTAREQGHVAGLNMVGNNTSYVKPVPFNVTRLAGLTTTIIGMVGRGVDEDLIGIARGDSETWRQLPDSIVAQSNFDVNRLRIMVGKHHLIGAIIMGDQTLSRPLHHLISNRVDIARIRDPLLVSQNKLGDLIASFWSEWRIANAT